MRRSNGSGHITKLAGNRRRPYAVRKIVGWSEKGTPKYKYISYHKTQREAERALNAYNADPYSLNGMTLDDLFREWYGIQEHEKAEATLRSYRVRYAHLDPLKETRITEINPFMLEKYYQNLDITKGTLEDVQVLVNLLMKYAVKRRYLPINALQMSKAINLPIKEEKRNKPHSVISQGDIDRLWTMTDNKYAKIILFYIYTGMRYSELRNLEAEDWHDNYVEIRQAKTMAGVRIVPICDKLKPLLPLDPVPPLTSYDRYLKMLLPGHSSHDTRHTFISKMTEAGIDVRIIKAIVGHKMADVTAIYTHISLEKMLDAVNRL